MFSQSDARLEVSEQKFREAEFSRSELAVEYAQLKARYAMMLQNQEPIEEKYRQLLEENARLSEELNNSKELSCSTALKDSEMRAEVNQLNTKYEAILSHNNAIELANKQLQWELDKALFRTNELEKEISRVEDENSTQSTHILALLSELAIVKDGKRYQHLHPPSSSIYPDI